MKLKQLFAAIAAALLCSAASAYTDCNTTVAWMYTEAGSSANLTVGLTVGSSFVLPSTDPAFKNVMALAPTAIISGNQITARYNASGLTCSSATGRTDLIGFYLYNT